MQDQLVRIIGIRPNFKKITCLKYSEWVEQLLKVPVDGVRKSRQPQMDMAVSKLLLSLHSKQIWVGFCSNEIRTLNNRGRWFKSQMSKMAVNQILTEASPLIQDLSEPLVAKGWDSAWGKQQIYSLLEKSIMRKKRIQVEIFASFGRTSNKPQTILGK